MRHLSTTKRSIFLVGALSVLVASCGDGKNATLSAPTPSPTAVVPPSYTLSGVISDARQAGVALEGVQVWAGPQRVTTDGDGFYSISGLANVSSIFVTKAGYKNVRKTL